MENRVATFTEKQRAQIVNLVGSGHKGKADEIVRRLQRRMDMYGRKTGDEEGRPIVECYAQTVKIHIYAEGLSRELANLERGTRHRLVKEIGGLDPNGDKPKEVRSRKRKGRRALRDAQTAATIVAAAVSRAQRKARRAVVEGSRYVDVQFRNLCADVAFDWLEVTGRPLPKLEYRSQAPKNAAPVPGTGLSVRHHPLWIVLDALGIKIDSYTLGEIMSLAQGEADVRLNTRDWRSPVTREAGGGNNKAKPQKGKPTVQL